jgi:hypothetical protein
VVSVRVGSAREAAGLLRGRHSAGVTVLAAREVTVSADTQSIPVGIDGEAVLLPAPVRCAVQPGTLRVRVPRARPGVPAPLTAGELDQATPAGRAGQAGGLTRQPEYLAEAVRARAEQRDGHGHG